MSQHDVSTDNTTWLQNVADNGSTLYDNGHQGGVVVVISRGMQNLVT